MSLRPCTCMYRNESEYPTVYMHVSELGVKVSIPPGNCKCLNMRSFPTRTCRCRNERGEMVRRCHDTWYSTSQSCHILMLKACEHVFMTYSRNKCIFYLLFENIADILYDETYIYIIHYTMYIFIISNNSFHPTVLGNSTLKYRVKSVFFQL